MQVTHNSISNTTIGNTHCPMHTESLSPSKWDSERLLNDLQEWVSQSPQEVRKHYEIAAQRITNAYSEKQTELSLSGLKISSLPPILFSLTCLEHLNLSGTKLETLSSRLQALVALETLTLENSTIKTLPTEIGQLASLKELNVSHTPIETLPPALAQLHKLITLNASNTPLHNWPEAFNSASNGLVNLEELNLSNTQITTLPNNMGFLAKLKALDLTNTPLTHLPVTISKLSELTFLGLAYTQVTDIPSELAQLSNMVNLNLCYTPFAEEYTLHDTVARWYEIAHHDSEQPWLWYLWNKEPNAKAFEFFLENLLVICTTMQSGDKKETINSENLYTSNGKERVFMESDKLLKSIPSLVATVLKCLQDDLFLRQKLFAIAGVGFYTTPTDILSIAQKMQETVQIYTEEDMQI